MDHFPAEVGRIERLLFSRPDWNQATGAPSVRRIHAARGAIKVGSFPNDDTHTMVLKLSTGQRLRLLVVPSDTGPAAAASVMHEVAG